MSNYMFELYKQNKSSSSKTKTVIQNNTGDNSAVRALLEEQQKQRQLQGLLEMMKRGLEMAFPKPKLNCRYNPIFCLDITAGPETLARPTRLETLRALAAFEHCRFYGRNCCGSCDRD